MSLALLVALALVAIAACAASAGATVGADSRAVGWAEASDDARARGVPTLINDVGQPRGGAESQLPIGVGLLALGLLGIGYGLWLLSATPSPPRTARDAPRQPSAHAPQL